jgi:hypothetical protein
MPAMFAARRRIPTAPAAGAVALVVFAVAVLAVGTSTAADPFQAGQVSTQAMTLPDQARTAIAVRADSQLRGLGLQKGVRRSIERIEDKFEAATYDEVTDFDANDQPVSMLQYRPDGVLRTAIALGWREGKGRPLPDAAAAGRRGRALGRIAGGPQTDPVVEPLVDGTGWGVSWPRSVDGVPVPGDGLRMDLWNDGSLHRLVRSERPLAPRPATMIDEAAARSIADGLLQSWYGPQRADLTIEAAPLAWVAPNDAFAPERPDAPASTLRLARVVAVSAGGSLGDRLERLEIYVDAGDGSLLGGDVLE